MIEMYVLEQLVAVYHHKTLSSAAHELHITQPALTRSMQKLESTIGVSLFQRTSNSIRLNAFGEEAARRAEDILSRETEMVRMLRQMERRTRTISIGACAPVPMVELQQRLSQTMVSQVISAELNTPEKLITGLQNRVYDLIAVNTPVAERGYSCIKIFTEHLYAYVLPEHPFAHRTSIRFSDLEGQTIITNSAIGVWKNVHQQYIPNAHFIELDGVENLNKLRNNSSLMSFATDRSLEKFGVQPPRIPVPFSDPEATMTFYAVFRSDDQRLAKAMQMTDSI